MNTIKRFMKRMRLLFKKPRAPPSVGQPPALHVPPEGYSFNCRDIKESSSADGASTHSITLSALVSGEKVTVQKAVNGIVQEVMQHTFLAAGDASKLRFRLRDGKTHPPSKWAVEAEWKSEVSYAVSASPPGEARGIDVWVDIAHENDTSKALGSFKVSLSASVGTI